MLAERPAHIIGRELAGVDARCSFSERDFRAIFRRLNSRFLVKVPCNFQPYRHRI